MADVFEQLGAVYHDQKPDLFSDLGAVYHEEVPAKQNDSIINKIANSAPVNATLGAGDALASTMSAGLVNPHNASGTAYNVGRFAGNVGGFIGGGELLDAARAGIEGVPLIGKMASTLGKDGLAGVVRRGLGSAAYGALTNPNDRTKGALEGAALSGAADALPPIFGLGAKAANLFRPQKYTNEIISNLGGGKSLEENAKSLADDIKNSYNQKVEEGNALYSPVFDTLGNSSIFDGIGPYSSSYQNLDKKIFSDYYDRKLGKLHSEFSENPSLANAHDLQSQLGYTIRKFYSKGQLDRTSRDELNGYEEAQSALKNDINTFLENQSPELAEQYQLATKNWAENVIPYVENKKISKIAKGDVENPRNVPNLFKNPESDIQKIAEDLGPAANNKIIYSELGKINNKISPENLLKSFDSLDQKGLASYLNPELVQQAQILKSRIGSKTALQRISGGLLGFSALHPFSHPALEIGGAVAGIAASPSVSRYLQKTLPLDKWGNAISEGTKKAYRPVSQAIIANALSNGLASKNF